MEPLLPIEPAVLTRLDATLRRSLLAVPPGRSRRLASVYVRGLLGPAARKNVERIAQQARGLARAPAFERDLREMLAADDWRHESLMWDASADLLAETSGWQAYTLDDTSLLKQGDQSVGVQNQYAGCVGGLANCQVLVSLGVAQEQASAPLAMQLYLPPTWDHDEVRRQRCHVPGDVRARPKWEIGRDLVAALRVNGLPILPLLADSLYGEVTELRRWLQERAQPYVVGVDFATTVWPSGTTFRKRPSPKRGGRPTTRLEPTTPCTPVAIGEFARGLTAEHWHTVIWRDGSRGPQRGRFAALRVRPGWGWLAVGVHPDDLCEEEWLLVHWPEDAPKPTKAWFSNLPPGTTLTELVALARLRWRVERDYREGKGLVGLDHFEGRTWSGLHHHAALVVVAQQFLARERLAELARGTPPELEVPRENTPPPAAVSP